MISNFHSLCLAFVLLLSLTACSSESSDSNSQDTSPTLTEADSGASNVPKTAQAPADDSVDPGHEGTYMNFPDEWGAFRSALANKNVAAIENYMATEDISAQDLLDLLYKDVLDAMFSTPYENLKDSDYMGMAVKEFAYQETSIDEDGNEIGAALFFYFEEQVEGLRLIGFLAAG